MWIKKFFAYEEKNGKLEENIKKLEKIIEKIQKNNKEKLDKLKIQMSSREKLILELDKKIKEKDIIIMKLKSNVTFDISSLNENIISIIFSSMEEDIIFPIICNNTDNFKIVENMFYEKYPENKNYNNIFKVKGRKINESKNLEENGINNNDIIEIYFYNS